MWNLIVLRKVNGAWCALVVERELPTGDAVRRECAVYGSRSWMIDVAAMDIDWREGRRDEFLLF